MSKAGSGRLWRGLAQSVFGTGFSRIMGAARDICIGHVLGAGQRSDAFWVAFTMPGIFRRFVADEGLTGVLVPAIQAKDHAEGSASAQRLARASLAALLLASLVICVVGFLAAPWLVKAFAYGFTEDPAQFELTVRLTRWLLPFVLTLSMLSWCEGLLNVRRQFFIPKMAPGLVGGSMAASAVLLSSHFEEPTMALVVGTLVGGALQVLVCLPSITRSWGAPLPLFGQLRNPDVVRFARSMGKVALIGVIAQLNIMVLRLVASLLAEGSVTHYWYAARMVDLSQGIIAVGVGSAALPELASAVSSNNWDHFRRDLHFALRIAGVLLIPAAALVYALALPSVSVLFLHGAYDLADATRTASTLRMMVPFMLSLGAIQVLKRAYFAIDDLPFLMQVGGVGLVLTGTLGFWLSTQLGVEGLALGLSVSTCIQALIYAGWLGRRSGQPLDLQILVAPFTRMALASIPALGVAWWIARFGAWEAGPGQLSNIVILVAAGFFGFATYLVSALVLKVEELHAILRRLRRR